MLERLLHAQASAGRRPALRGRLRFVKTREGFRGWIPHEQMKSKHRGDGARLCPRDQPQRVDYFRVLRLVLRTQPRSFTN